MLIAQIGDFFGKCNRVAISACSRRYDCKQIASQQTRSGLFWPNAIAGNQAGRIAIACRHARRRYRLSGFFGGGDGVVQVQKLLEQILFGRKAASRKHRRHQRQAAGGKATILFPMCAQAI